VRWLFRVPLNLSCPPLPPGTFFPRRSPPLDRLSGFPRRSARGSRLERERAEYAGAKRPRARLLRNNAQRSVSLHLCTLVVYPNVMTRAIHHSFSRWGFVFPLLPLSLSLSLSSFATLRKVSRHTRRVNRSLKCFTTSHLISARKDRAGSLASSSIYTLRLACGGA